MTIIYQYKVATTTFFGFFKLLRRWRGSVYKLMYKETIIFCSLYTVISLVYRLALNPGQRRTFERIAAYCNSYTNLIPVSFVLGFYVSIIVTRWWQQFQNVPWPDRTLYILGSYLVGQDERGRIYRRTVARYMLFALILILRSVSVSVMKRYPTMEHIVDAGFITKEEVLMYEQVECKYNKFWVPLVWANSIITQARKEGRIESEMGFRLVLEYIADYRDKCSLCFVYDWITIPLVYTQVVTLAVYMFFGACLIGRQYVDNDEDNPDLYVPFFTLLQFFFYMGWLKVAEQMINPFGEDDDDYDMNWLIDRHTAVAMCLADQCHANYPPLVKDAHFNEIAPELPYTEAAMSSRRPNFMGSTYNLERPSMMEQKIVQNSPLASSLRGLRRRSNTAPRHGTGSTWSLFGFKPNLQRGGLSSSRETITSTMMNGHAGLGPLNYHDPYYQREHRDSTESRVSENVSLNEPAALGNNELPPEYVPLRRARATTDAAHRPLQRVANYERERKWSFPLSLLRKKHERDATGRGYLISSTQEQPESGQDQAPLLTPPTPRSRFRVDLVPEDQEVDASKQTRNKQLLDKHMGFLSVSRPPVLSAIEERNTIRSVKDLIPSPLTHSLSSLGDCSYLEGDRHMPSTIIEETGDDVFYENENDNLISNAVNKLLRSSTLSDPERYQTTDDPGSTQTDIFRDPNLTTEPEAVRERYSIRETAVKDYAGSQEFQTRRKSSQHDDDDDDDNDGTNDNDDDNDLNYADDAGAVDNLKTFNVPTVKVSEDGEENSLGSVFEDEEMLDSKTNICRNDLKESNESLNNKKELKIGDRDSPIVKH